MSEVDRDRRRDDLPEETASAGERDERGDAEAPAEARSSASASNEPGSGGDGATADDADAGTTEPGGAVGDDQDGSAELDWDVAAEAEPRTKGELLRALAEVERERDEYLDDLRRSHADFENYRKRVMRESASQLQAGKASVASSLLEVLDDLDRTLQAAAESDDTALAKGVELVASKLVRSLQGDGLERIDASGVPFDPNEHEAVQQLDAEEPTETPRVAQVLRPGYRIGDRVLRAAMVVVEQ